MVSDQYIKTQDSRDLADEFRKTPFRLSPTRKANLRKRLRRVDDVIAAVAESGVETRSLSRAVALPKEHEMEPKGKSSCTSRVDMEDLLIR